MFLINVLSKHHFHKFATDNTWIYLADEFQEHNFPPHVLAKYYFDHRKWEYVKKKAIEYVVASKQVKYQRGALPPLLPRCPPEY